MKSPSESTRELGLGLGLNFNPTNQIPVNRDHFEPYSYFHKNILKLPFIEMYDSEHCVQINNEQDS